MKKPGNKPIHISIRFDKETHDKLFHIAEYEGRSGSGQIMYLIRKCISDYERDHGLIDLTEKED